MDDTYTLSEQLRKLLPVAERMGLHDAVKYLRTATFRMGQKHEPAGCLFCSDPACDNECIVNEIIERWDEWDAEAGQAAQVEQHPDAYTQEMRQRLAEVLMREPSCDFCDGKGYVEEHWTYGTECIRAYDCPYCAREKGDA